MKKLLLLMLAAAGVLLLAQCRKKDAVAVAPVTDGVRMTVTVGPGRTDITSTGAIRWSEGDVIYVGDGHKCIGSLTLQSGENTVQGTFSGTIGTLSTGTYNFHYYYLGNCNGVEPEFGDASADVSFACQNVYESNGELMNAKMFHVGYGCIEGVDVTLGQTVSVSGIVTMETQVAFAQFKFMMGSNEYTGGLSITNLPNTMKVSFDAKDGFSYEASGSGISLGNNHTDRYAVLIPKEGATVVRFGMGAEGEAHFAGGIEAGRLYRNADRQPINVEVVLQKSGTDAEGREWVNFNDPNGATPVNGMPIWAKWNLGTTSETEVGEYYAWGCTEPNNYTILNTWPFNGGASTFDAEYFATVRDKICNNMVLSPAYDAAAVKWKGGWHMPTGSDISKLCKETTVSRTTGSKIIWTFKDKNDETKYVSFVCGGRMYDGSVNTTWELFSLSNTIVSFSTGTIIHMWGQDKIYAHAGFNVCTGAPVRPVR